MDLWSLAIMAGLGAYHGLNPAMGWLFAVGLGLQERSRGALLRALGPIALGHELAIGVVAVLVVGLGVFTDPGPLRMGAAAALVAFGIFRFARPRAHPRWAKMKVTKRELTWWSFLMSSAHGAGLMVAPVLVGSSVRKAGHDHENVLASLGEAAAVLLVHVGAMLAAMAFVAVLVYEHFGVSILRKAWLNTDHLWAGAFVVAGTVTLFS
ncbi:MAG TPA: hypothetical protein VN238_19570 [Solirubrobacteraceae bacterium]|nr:hypothetical protein [Solirubrobacteraceae bacterium]